MSEERPSGPNGLALVCRARIEALRAEMEGEGTKDQRRRLRALRDAEKWCKTRAGYVTPGKGKADG